MDSQPQDSALPARRDLSITETAMHLGVSERTVYRRLKEGKLRRSVSDKKGRHVRLILDLSSGTGHSKATDRGVMSDNMSDRISVAAWEALQQELRAKDEQIAGLIEQRQEMQAALQRLQEQIFELAHLTLSQNAPVGFVRPESSAASSQVRRRGWWSWRRQNRTE
ncbi:MAG TPA: helix-turn-helix domain-containing protein [Chthonomonadaceae bacterium]|nr:helix-turn-helix domain-containing protein [Chthonomonadaceae bacterium]